MTKEEKENSLSLRWFESKEEEEKNKIKKWQKKKRKKIK